MNDPIIKCAFCKGTGRSPNGILYIRPCEACNGKGVHRASSCRKLTKAQLKRITNTRNFVTQVQQHVRAIDKLLQDNF